MEKGTKIIINTNPKRVTLSFDFKNIAKVKIDP
jgi:hypothetical protein